MTRKMITLLALCSMGCSLAVAQSIDVNFAQPDAASSDLFGHYINFTGEAEPISPADFKLYQEQFGRLKMVRIWGSAGIDYAAQVSDEALMVDGKGIELNRLLSGELTEDQAVAAVEKHLGEMKAKYPFITHIEPFNELTDKALRLPAGMTVEDAYYRGYRVTMRAVADLNRKNHYAKPLLSGGTACMWPQYKKNYMKNFLAAYAKDPDPAKHMDFLSVHYYVDDFAAAASFRHDMEALMAGYHLPAIPLIMSELGWKEPGAKRYSSDKSASLRWATGALSHAYEIAEQNIPPMHWVYPRKEDRMSMAAPANESPALLPKGNAVRMAQMLKQNHVKSTVSIDKNGYGVYSIATYDSDGIAILLFNYDGGGESVKNVTLHLLNADKLGAKSGSVTEYRLDRTHANYFADKNAWQLAPVGEAAVPLSALNGKTVQLNGNAAQLIVVTFPK